MTRVTIIGPGAIGSTLAARLTLRPDVSVSLAARTPIEAISLRYGEERLLASPEVMVDPAVASPSQWVMVTTKAYDAAGAARWLEPLVAQETHVAIVQNGVEHVQRFRPWVEESMLLPVMIDLPAERVSPGVVVQHGDGHMTVPDSPAGREFASLFEGTGIATRTTDDMTSALWHKLCLNSVGAINAATLAPPRIARHDPVAELVRGIVTEAIAVGRAEGAVLDDALADRIVEDQRRGPGGGINSMHADRLAGRPMEIDARNGAIVRGGRRHGIATPLNAALVALLEGVERYANAS